MSQRCLELNTFSGKTPRSSNKNLLFEFSLTFKTILWWSQSLFHFRFLHNNSLIKLQAEHLTTSKMKWRCDHRSCDCDLSNRKLSPQKVFGASMGFEAMVSALALQCSTKSAMKTHTLEVGQFIEFIVPVKRMKHEYYVNCGRTNEMKMWSSQLLLRFKQSQIKPEKCFRGFYGNRFVCPQFT